MPKSFQFDYELHEAGWATARIRDEKNSVDMTVSYLHDSLRALANAAFAISRGPATRRVVFLDEPGEHQLTLVRDEGPDCLYYVRWFNDWDSWGMRTIPGSKDICDGSVPVRRLIHQVYNSLWVIHNKYGLAGYKERWIEHEFSFDEMQRLVGITKHSAR